MQIAFIGLGNMGGPMAINLVKAGHSVKAFDLSQDAVAKVVAEGGQAAASAQDAVQGAEAIVTMLPASQHVEGLFLGRDGQPGLLGQIAKGALIIDSSTIAAATSQKVAKAAEAAGIDFIDAPVSGGEVGAKAASLTIMVGGRAAAYERAKPLFELMGRNIGLVGGSGDGHATKLATLAALTLGLMAIMRMTWTCRILYVLVVGIWRAALRRLGRGDHLFAPLLSRAAGVGHSPRPTKPPFPPMAGAHVGR